MDREDVQIKKGVNGYIIKYYDYLYRESYFVCMSFEELTKRLLGLFGEKEEESGGA
jgi:hypothetical protein